MDASKRIFVALDVAQLDQACHLAEELAPTVGGLKVGLELLTSVGAPRVVEAMQRYELPLFFDAKFKDIPNTVAGAVRAAAKLGVAMQNIHALGGMPMMRAAVLANEEGAQEVGHTKPTLLAVTLLTSYAPDHLHAVGFGHIDSERALHDHAVVLAKMAQDAGCDGVVASPHEVAAIRAACGPNFTIVTPGVRPEWASTGDQVRVMTPQDAIAAGADYVVIGRPITKPPAAYGGPRMAAERIIEEMR